MRAKKTAILICYIMNQNDQQKHNLLMQISYNAKAEDNFPSVKLVLFPLPSICLVCAKESPSSLPPATIKDEPLFKAYKPTDCH